MVTLAAAGRSAGVTTAITYDVRAGTSICDSADRASRQPTASGAVGMKAARISSPFAGQVGEHHRADEADARGDAHGDERRERRQHAGPEEHGPAHGERQAEAALQPQHEQRGDDEAAAERVEAEQRGEPVDDPTATARARGAAPVAGPLDGRREAAVAEQHDHAEHGVGDEGPPQRRSSSTTPSRSPTHSGHAGAQRAERRRRARRSGCSGRTAPCVARRAAVAGSSACSVGRNTLTSPPLGFSVPTSPTRASGQNDGERGEPEPGRDHQQRHELQQPAPRVGVGRAARRPASAPPSPSSVAVTTMPMRTSRQPDGGEVGGEHDADQPVAEGPHAARLEQQPGIPAGTGRQHSHHHQCSLMSPPSCPSVSARSGRSRRTEAGFTSRERRCREPLRRRRSPASWWSRRPVRGRTRSCRGRRCRPRR